MKKLFALVLAVAMVMSLAAVTMASTTETSVGAVSPKYYKYSSSNGYMTTGSADPTVSYGNTFFYPIHNNEATAATVNALTAWSDVNLATEADTVKSVKLSKEWSVGKDLVKSVEIVKKKYGSATTNYAYFLAVTVVPGTGADAVDICGEVTLKKTSGANKILVGNGEITVKVDTTVEYDLAAPMNVITDSKKLYKFENADADEAFEFTFSKMDDATFTTNTKGQKKLVLAADVKFNADLAAAYPDANLDFFNGNGASFNKTGVLYLPSETAAFCYKVGADNALTVAAAYDEAESGFMVKTRTLGKYVISDVELTNLTAAVKPVAPVTPEVVAPVNPGMGAAA